MIWDEITIEEGWVGLKWVRIGLDEKELSDGRVEYIRREVIERKHLVD